VYVKQSTAVNVILGPFVDSTDGVTAETALTISQADIRLSKNGAAFAQTNNATGATHRENGHYLIPLDSTDTNTLGQLRVAVAESGALPCWLDLEVVTANVWDSLFSTDLLQVDVTQVSGDTTAADNLEAAADGTGYKFDGVGISFEADSVINRAVVTGLDGKTATATDAGSIATYFIQTTSITNSLLHEQTSIDDAADYLLNPEPEPRYTSVATKYLMLTTAQKDTLATVDIGDTISVEKTFASGTGTTQLAQELSVEGIEHRLDFSTGHSVLYSTAPTTIVYELILDDAIYGVLDAENVLG